MRRLFIFLFALFIVNNVSGNDCLLFYNDNPNNSIVIHPIQVPPPTTSTEPRSLIEPDIEAYYYCGVITFTFNVDFDYANIVVRNVATGDEWYDSYSGYGSTSIALNGDSGYYEVTIYTDNGDYIGNFII